MHKELTLAKCVLADLQEEQDVGLYVNARGDALEFVVNGDIGLFWSIRLVIVRKIQTDIVHNHVRVKFYSLFGDALEAVVSDMAFFSLLRHQIGYH